MPWPLATAPTGWLKCNGAAFSATDYPQLAKAYTSLTLPDLRGEFIRGWDDGRGIDSGRALLTLQEATWIQPNIENNTSATAIQLGNGERDFNTAEKGAVSGLQGVSNAGARIRKFMRPRNVAFNYIVRAA
ncbi:tail fiber protein [Erwinia tracheiphila]|uniref:phage tail protein n=1 Tax=Erwinia tracheiphila TaxID=65700 RepID=UPI001F41D0DC|nr:phage tail protein [Erwinia tracheiphila]UIA83590.1 tail fiber protein [Erwinia tracheiphila]UIA92174.1 tail fiber protein [Erwinia tracheiphila]